MIRLVQRSGYVWGVEGLTGMSDKVLVRGQGYGYYFGTQGELASHVAHQVEWDGVDTFTFLVAKRETNRPDGPSVVASDRDLIYTKIRVPSAAKGHACVWQAVGKAFMVYGAFGEVLPTVPCPRERVFG